MSHPIEVDYLRWIVLAPLLGAAVNGLAGAALQKRFGKHAVSAIALATVAISFALSVRAFAQLLGLAPEQRFLLDAMSKWIHIGSLKVDLAFWLDPLSSTMILVVTGIGGLIHLYSVGYMSDEPSYWRYFTYLNLFMAAMLTLVLGDSLLTMFVGWEGVGLCSYALIGFWHKEWANASAGSKAFITNRVGDFGFVLGMFALFWTLDRSGQGTLVFREVAQRLPLLDGQMVWGIAAPTFITLMLFVGACGKSAQIPLHVWLPDAMAGPTPVSALIHAATMVTAGVYMIARLNFLFDLAPDTLHVVAVIGTLTAFMAATIGVAQFDIKKVLAYSTVSQLGFMFIAMGVGAYSAGVFHLFTHAFFKACLFLGSGSVIHALHHEQDVRHMGGLKKHMPVTFWTFAFATLALAGVPPMAGFISKDEILFKAFSSPQGSPIIWFLGSLTAGFTAFYMFRQVFMVFFGEYRGGHHGHAGHADEHAPHAHGHVAAEPHESPALMTIPLVLLAAGSILAGMLNVPAALGGHHAFDNWLAPVIAGSHVPHAAAPATGEHGVTGAVEHEARVLEHDAETFAHDVETEPSEYVLMGFSVAVALGGILLAYLMYYRRSIDPEFFARAWGAVPYRLVYNKYYFDEIYEATVIRGTLVLSRALATFDRVVIDGLVNGAGWLVRQVSALDGAFDRVVVDGIVNLIGRVSLAIGNRARGLQTGHIYSYLYAIVIGVVVIMFVRLL
ncbi:MAG TPA: NADH-quinone oxidoreductase subunit L [Candidatus Binatia bacterium]|nr:NADH-quinone oxidoreductase subunit L [Candidatus Binatia bacterium]